MTKLSATGSHRGSELANVKKGDYALIWVIRMIEVK